ncbi:MAG TPA: SRPBCC family protein [Myxococcaceae bacterium]|nr:SRPBCC family protein [Myxococcaceae bacterium]
MLRKVLIGLAALVVVLLVVIATRPSTYRVERSTRIAAPPEVVFGLVNDFHAWDRWSPWAKLDPEMKTTYGGPTSGAGASYAWTGNSKVGEGKMRITESRPAQKVDIRLEFIKPMAGISQTEFSFRPESGGTQVSWVMTGTNDFMGKAFSLVADMDAMIGKDFEKGLGAMRAEAEADARRRAEAATASATSAPSGSAAPVLPAAAPTPAK